jgi:flagellar motor protein MotB
MPSRFRNRASTSRAVSSGSPRAADGLGEWWAAIAVIAFALLAIVSLSGSMGAGPGQNAAGVIEQITPRLLGLVAPAERSISSIEAAFASLCQEPVLVGLELEPDCETGVITLPESLFKPEGRAELGTGAREYVAAAMTNYLARMRRLPAIWDSLEAIEIRGHSDPRAMRNPYETNMVGSQQKALGVLLFLVGPQGLSESDAEDLERLAVVSGVSYSRPPASCPESDRRCYGEWRRVEIRPVLSETLRRGDWARTVEDLRVTTLQIQKENQVQDSQR